LEPPLLQRSERRRQLVVRAPGGPRRRRCDPELRDEPARPPLPRQREVLARPGDADVEQAALLGDRRLVAERLLARQLTLLETRDEDGIPFEALGAVEGEQVDAALGAVVEPLAEPRDPLGHRARTAVEPCGQPPWPGEVGL